MITVLQQSTKQEKKRHKKEQTRHRQKKKETNSFLKIGCVPESDIYNHTFNFNF